MALVDTVGGTDSNSYVSVQAATAYFAERLNADVWTDDDDLQEPALIQATRWLDTVEFTGVKVAQGQALKWPRYGAVDDDGYEFDTAAIPAIIVHATCELALKLLNDGSTDTFANTGLEGFNRAKVGPLDVEIRHTQKAGALPEHVMDILRPVVRNSGNTMRTELA